MAFANSTLVRPAQGADYRAPSKQRRRGLALAAVGVVLAMIVLVAGLAASALIRSDDDIAAAHILSWTFGLNTLALSVIKVGIAVILIGILVRLWFRVESVKVSLPDLKANAPDEPIRSGTVSTQFGTAVVTDREPKPLPIHRMAQRLWAPMLAMGVMAVVAGFVLSLVQAGNVGTATALSQSAWVQGIQFLGEGFILSGVAFLLGSILASLRSGGARVQESVGAPVKTLKMPKSAKIFVALMMVGLAVEIFQFVAYIDVAQLTDPSVIAARFAWLGPVREVGLGLLLSSIVLALATIGNALAFQFSRIVEIIKTGR